MSLPSYRSITSRTSAALLGGYGLSITTAYLIGQLLPITKSDAVLASLMCCFAIYPVIIMRVFAAPTDHAAWRNILLPLLVNVFLVLLLQLSGWSLNVSDA